MKSEDHIIPIGVLTPLVPLHFRCEAQEDAIKEIRIREAKSILLSLVFAG